MANIAILTYHNTPNFGATLQSYAFYKFLEGLGHSVEIINYMPKPALKKYLKSQSFGKRRSLSNIGKALKFYTFFKTTMTSSGPPIFNASTLSSLDDGRYDIAFVGSDEVWKVDHMRHLDGSFYLDFLSKRKTRLCSFSASCSAVTDLRDHSTTVRPWLERLDDISVRDRLTHKYVSDICPGRNVTMTCDPTLLWDFGSGSYPTLNHHSRYVALYAWTDDEQSLAVREFADRNSLALIGVGVKNKLCDFSYLNIGPQQWLGLMKGAEVVVTDFFHGVVFAILFDRPFFAFSAEKKRVKIEEFITDASLDHLLSDTVMPLPSLTIDDLSYGKDHLARFLDVKKASEEYLLRNISMCS